MCRACLISYAKRTLTSMAGLFLFAIGIYLQIISGVGVAPWNVLNDGLAQAAGLTFGDASILISFLILMTDLALKEPIGLGTLLDAILIGIWVDWLTAWGPVPPPQTLLYQVLITAVSIFIICYGQYVYMSAGLSCGPRDALMVAVGKRLPRIPIGTVNILLMSLALLGGFLMGGSTGLGTVLAMVCMGFCMDLVFGWVHFEPRSVHQESLVETFRNLRAALAAPQEK